MFNNTFTEFATEKVKDLLFVNKANGNFGISYDNRKGFTTRLHARYKGRRLERDGFSRARPLITKENYYTKGDINVKFNIDASTSLSWKTITVNGETISVLVKS